MRAWLVKPLTPDITHVPHTAVLMQIMWACNAPAAQIAGVSLQEMPGLCLSHAAAGCGHIIFSGGWGKRPSHFHNSSKPNLNPAFDEISLHSCCSQPVSSTRLLECSVALSDKTQLLQTASTKTAYHCYYFKIATIKFETDNINGNIKKKKKYCFKLKSWTSERKLNDLRNK